MPSPALVTAAAVVALAAPAAALAAGSAGDRSGTEVTGRAGVRVVDPPAVVRRGASQVPVGVRFTDTSARRGVQSVSVRLRRAGQTVGSAMFHADGSHDLRREGLVPPSGGRYVVRYEITLGTQARVHGIQFPLRVAPR